MLVAILTLGNGATVILDDEDYDFACQDSWHIYLIRPSRKPAVARTQMRHGRMARLHLHREVVARMRPDIVMKKFRVRPRNGDFLDCRRENLEIAMVKPKPGPRSREPRPIGWERNPLKRGKKGQPPASPLWAGGLVWKLVDKRGRGARIGERGFRLCLGGRPID